MLVGAGRGTIGKLLEKMAQGRQGAGIPWGFLSLLMHTHQHAGRAALLILSTFLLPFCVA